MKTPARKIFNQSKNALLAEKVRSCRNFFTRMKGLLGTKHLPRDEACWIVPCSQVHTLGMRYPIDVYFLDKQNQVIKIVKDLRPNRISPWIIRARSVVEFSAGVDRPCQLGDTLVLGGGK